VFEQLQSQLGKLLGPKTGEDEQNPITAEQLKQVLKSIEGKYNNLKNENRLYKAKIEEQKATIAELERSMSELRNAGPSTDTNLLTQLEADLNVAQQQLLDTQDALANLRAEKLQLQSKLSVQEALVSSLRHEISELREGHAGSASPEDHAKALAEVEKLGFENQQLNDRVQELLGQLLSAEGVKGDVARKQTEIDSLKQDLAEVKGQLETALQARRQAEVERDGVSSRLAPVIDELDELREKVESVSKERNQVSDAYATTQAELAIAEERANKAEEELEQFQQDKQELRHQVTKLQGEVEALQGQLAGGGPQARVLAELEDRVLAYKAQMEQAAVEKQALQARIQQLVDEPSGLSAREKTEFELEIKRLTDEHREATLQISNLREAKVKANLDLEEAAAELIELRRQIDEMRRDRNQFRDRLSETRAQSNEMDELKSQMRELMLQMSQMRGGGGSVAAPPPEQATGVRESASQPLPEITPAPASGNLADSGSTLKSNASENSMSRRREVLNRLIGDKKAPRA
jgi:chromosome segregation ATPase